MISIEENVRVRGVEKGSLAETVEGEAVKGQRENKRNKNNHNNNNKLKNLQDLE